MRFLNLGIVALAGVASSKFSTIPIEALPPGLVDSPAEPPPDKLCSSTLGIIRPCTSFSKSADPTVTTAISTTLTRPTKTAVSSTPVPSTTSTAPSPTNSPDKIKECFLPHGPCEGLFQNMTSLWDTLSEDTPVWTDYRPFDLKFCDPNEIDIRELVSLPSCSHCLSPSTPPSPWPSLQKAIQSFCLEDTPSIYTLSKSILDFADRAVEKPFNITPAGLNPRVAELVSAWDKKQPSRRSSMTMTMTTSTSVPPGATSLPQQVITRGLSQLPHAWPYTRAGVARRAGETARFTVTRGLEGGVGEFVVVEGVVWNPRPLNSVDLFGNFTQSVVGGGATSVGAGETTASASGTRRSSIDIPTLTMKSKS